MAAGRRTGVVALVGGFALATALTVGPPGTSAMGLAPRAAQAPRPSPSRSVVFGVDHVYGTLAFKGAIERADLGEEYEYRPHIAITFRPNERTNRVPVANLAMCQLVATIPNPEGGRATVLSRQTEAAAVLLSVDGETKPLPEVTFRLPKSIAAAAGHIGLDVTDMHLLWPIPVELK